MSKLMQEYEALQMLARAVIKTAAEDLVKPDPQGSMDLGIDTQQDAYRFFFPGDVSQSWLQHWSDLAGVNTLAIQDLARKAWRGLNK